MFETLPELPLAWQGLWKRTLLERRGPGVLTNDRPARVFWLQTALYHADLRIPLERPDFSGITSLKACDDDQLRFLAGQEAFFGITRVEGGICTWLRLHDLKPGTGLDVARMAFDSGKLLVEMGIAEDYLEHWSLVDGSKPDGCAAPALRLSETGLFLQSGAFAVALTKRPPAPPGIDAYEGLEEQSRDHLMWLAALELCLCRREGGRWVVRHATHPWKEGRTLDDLETEKQCA